MRNKMQSVRKGEEEAIAATFPHACGTPQDCRLASDAKVGAVKLAARTRVRIVVSFANL